VDKVISTNHGTDNLLLLLGIFINKEILPSGVKNSNYRWTFLYLTAVASYFSWLCFKLGNFDVKWTTLDVTNVCKLKITSLASLNIMSTNLMSTAMQWTETRGPQHTETWSSGKSCTACCHPKQSEFRVMRIVKNTHTPVFIHHKCHYL